MNAMNTPNDAAEKSKHSDEEPLESYSVPLNDEPRPARRSGKQRSARFKPRSQSLDKSFTEFMDSTPQDELEEITTQIESTLSSLPQSVTESLKTVERRPSGGHYAPARRPSRAGSELAKSMKEIAQKALLELGDFDDDSDDELNGLSNEGD